MAPREQVYHSLGRSRSLRFRIPWALSSVCVPETRVPLEYFRVERAQCFRDDLCSSGDKIGSEDSAVRTMRIVRTCVTL